MAGDWWGESGQARSMLLIVAASEDAGVLWSELGEAASVEDNNKLFLFLFLWGPSVGKQRSGEACYREQGAGRGGDGDLAHLDRPQLAACV